jgi:hypothetical protein
MGLDIEMVLFFAFYLAFYLMLCVEGSRITQSTKPIHDVPPGTSFFAGFQTYWMVSAPEREPFFFPAYG